MINICVYGNILMFFLKRRIYYSYEVGKQEEWGPVLPLLDPRI